MKLLLTTILLVCLSYGVFASPFAGYGAGEQLVHRSKRSDCQQGVTERDCTGAESDRCKHCGCPDKNGNDVCMLIRCRND